MKKIQNKEECIKTLKKLSENLRGLFPSYIFHIRFPKFKNLSTNTRIDFLFPVTALVGANGSGKTSVLHALYGAPYGYSTGEFWFSTEVDPIEEGDGGLNRFIYGHYHLQTKTIVETRKARVRKISSKGVENPDYWEPTKVTLGDGMKKIPILDKREKILGLSKDRWNPVTREVLYINFRKELSAFDKYFYFGNDPHPKLLKLKKKQDMIRRDAKVLQKIIDSGDTAIEKHNKKTTLENRDLSDEELLWVKFILGRDYNAARYIRHNLFKGLNGVSVQFKTNFGKYSEAFAGSGEVAVTSVVVQVLKAKKGTLILLDEPEVSLHPGAQERLLIFLLQKAKIAKVQIIFSTHAPNMLSGLPNDAIKVFTQDERGLFSIIPQTDPYAAFRRLGIQHGGEINLIVEDRLAKCVVEQALLKMNKDERSRFKIDYPPGGADSVLKYHIPIQMYHGDNFFFLLDGDKRTDCDIDPASIPEDQNESLESSIKKVVGLDPHFTPDGNGQGNKSQLIVLRRKYLKYIHTNLRYLPLSCPEEIILKACPELMQNDEIVDTNHAKEILKSAAAKVYGDNLTSEKIDSYSEVKLSEHRDNSEELEEIVKILREFSNRIAPP